MFAAVFSERKDVKACSKLILTICSVETVSRLRQAPISADPSVPYNCEINDKQLDISTKRFSVSTDRREFTFSGTESNDPSNKTVSDPINSVQSSGRSAIPKLPVQILEGEFVGGFTVYLLISDETGIVGKSAIS